MALYRRKEASTWYADHYVNGQVQESSGTVNKREAEKFLALRSSVVQRGVYVKPVQVPMPKLWERYLAYAKTHKRSWKRDEQMYGKLKAFLGTWIWTPSPHCGWRIFSSTLNALERSSRSIRQCDTRLESRYEGAGSCEAANQ